MTGAPWVLNALRSALSCERLSYDKVTRKGYTALMNFGPLDHPVSKQASAYWSSVRTIDSGAAHCL